MFDIGFSELMVIAVVALVVIGPERLPAVARTLGHLFGRLQRYVNDVKADISREMELDELKKFKSQFEEAAQSMESSVRNEMASAESTMNSIPAQASQEDAMAAVTAPHETAVPEQLVSAPVTAGAITPPGVPPDVPPAEARPAAAGQLPAP